MQLGKKMAIFQQVWQIKPWLVIIRALPVLLDNPPKHSYEILQD